MPFQQGVNQMFAGQPLRKAPVSGVGYGAMPEQSKKSYSEASPGYSKFQSNVLSGDLPGQRKPTDTLGWLRSMIGSTEAQRQAGLQQIAAQTGANLRKASAHAAGRGLAGSGAAGAMRGQALAGKQIAEGQLEANLRNQQIQAALQLTQAEQMQQKLNLEEFGGGLSVLTQTWADLQKAGEVHDEDWPLFAEIFKKSLDEYARTGDVSVFAKNAASVAALGGDV